MILAVLTVAGCGAGSDEQVVADAIDAESIVEDAGSTSCTKAGFMEYLGDRATVFECETTFPAATGFGYEGDVVTGCYVYVDETVVDVSGSEVETSDGFATPCPSAEGASASDSEAETLAPASGDSGSVVGDIDAPVVEALPSSGRPGHVELRYRVTDASNRTRERVQIISLGIVQATRRTEWGGPTDGRVWVLRWNVRGVPTELPLRFCVVSQDEAGNRSKPSCARLRVPVIGPAEPKKTA